MTYLTNREAALHLCNGGKLEICLRDEWYPGTGGNILLYPESIDSPSPYRADAAATTTPAEQTGDVGQAWRVKPLVWEDLGNGSAYRAKAPLFGSIRVEAYYSGGFHILWSVPGFCDNFTLGLYPTAELAQAAAQADYAARIAAALEPDPTPALGWKAMQTAAERAAAKITLIGSDAQQQHSSLETSLAIRHAILAITGPTADQLLEEAVKLEAVRELVRAAKWIGVVAQTTGGTAGPDLDLIEAIDVLADALAQIGGAA